MLFCKHYLEVPLVNVAAEIITKKGCWLSHAVARSFAEQGCLLMTAAHNLTEKLMYADQTRMLLLILRLRRVPF